jgi:hypothetical protein
MDQASGIVIAVASNVEFDQPTELVEEIIRGVAP